MNKQIPHERSEEYRWWFKDVIPVLASLFEDAKATHAKLTENIDLLVNKDYYNLEFTIWKEVRKHNHELMPIAVLEEKLEVARDALLTRKRIHEDAEHADHAENDEPDTGTIDPSPFDIRRCANCFVDPSEAEEMLRKSVSLIGSEQYEDLWTEIETALKDRGGCATDPEPGELGRRRGLPNSVRLPILFLSMKIWEAEKHFPKPAESPPKRRRGYIPGLPENDGDDDEDGFYDYVKGDDESDVPDYIPDRSRDTYSDPADDTGPFSDDAGSDSWESYYAGSESEE